MQICCMYPIHPVCLSVCLESEATARGKAKSCSLKSWIAWTAWTDGVNNNIYVYIHMYVHTQICVCMYLNSTAELFNLEVELSTADASVTESLMFAARTGPDCTESLTTTR